MSDAGTLAREANNPGIGGAAVDQGARAADTNDRVLTELETIDELRRQLAEKEGQTAAQAEEVRRANEQARAAESAASAAAARAREADNARAHAEVVSERTVAQTQLESLSATLDSARGQMTGFKGQLRQAMEEGDYTKVADIQAEMAELGGKIVTLEGGKATLEDRVKAAPDDAGGRGPGTGGQQQQQPQTDYEKRIAFTQSQPAVVQTWLNGPNGDRFFNDMNFRQQVMRAAGEAERTYNPASPQYIEDIETRIGLRQPAGQQPSNTGGAASGGRDPSGDGRMVSAPAGGASGGSVRNAPGDGQMYLTSAERSIAANSGMTDAEYARAKQDLEREGLIGSRARR